MDFCASEQPLEMAQNLWTTPVSARKNEQSILQYVFLCSQKIWNSNQLLSVQLIIHELFELIKLMCTSITSSLLIESLHGNVFLDGTLVDSCLVSIIAHFQDISNLFCTVIALNWCVNWKKAAREMKSKVKGKAKQRRKREEEE